MNDDVDGVAAPRELNWWDELPQELICRSPGPNTVAARFQHAADALALCALTAGDRLEPSVARVLSDARNQILILAQAPDHNLHDHRLRTILSLLDAFDWRSLEPQAWAHIKRCDRELAAVCQALRESTEEKPSA